MLGLNVASKLLVTRPEFAQILRCSLQIVASNRLQPDENTAADIILVRLSSGFWASPPR